MGNKAQWSCRIREAACAAMLLAAFCGGSSGHAIAASDETANHPAPVFSRVELHGKKIDLADYRGKVILLNFWATWCAPCRVELPRFSSWQTSYEKQGLQVLAVSMDDNEALTRGVVQKLRLSFPVMMGDAKLGDLYGGIFGFPVTFLIDRKGIIRQRIEGEADLDKTESRVKALLLEPGR